MPRFRTSPFTPRTNGGGGRLTPLTLRGRNPGALAAHVHIPTNTAPNPALVVVLHGCTQTAGGYDQGSGWSTLADSHGFILLFPEQQRGNNANLCFNWFEPGDTARGKGEVESIREMIAQVSADQGVDPARIFVTGLSAGGAMTAVMLAAHPELFAAGAVIAGLPVGYAGSVPEALELMRAGPRGDAAHTRVPIATGHSGRWPRLSVWHGDADRTVNSVNADALLRQWTALHDLPDAPTAREATGGHLRRAWSNSAGEVLIEDHRITGMGHGTPLAAGEGDDRCGTPGAYMIEVGVSSSHEIARFFGIIDATDKAGAEKTAQASPVAVSPPVPAGTAGPTPRRMEVIGRSRPEPASTVPDSVQGVIENALRSAGLMK